MQKSKYTCNWITAPRQPHRAISEPRYGMWQTRRVADTEGGRGRVADTEGGRGRVVEGGCQREGGKHGEWQRESGRHGG